MFRAGDLARIEADAGFGLILPGGKHLALHGQVVQVLGVKNYTIMGQVSPSIVFRPHPWEFEQDAYPNNWEASERYFKPCESATTAKKEK